MWVFRLRFGQFGLLHRLCAFSIFVRALRFAIKFLGFFRFNLLYFDRITQSGLMMSQLLKDRHILFVYLNFEFRNLQEI